MTKEQANQIEEGNRLIADFMGWQHHPDKEYDEYEMAQLKYHKSWDWFIPACHKWDNLNELLGNPEYEARCEELDRVASLYQIRPLWHVLVENIKWFNQQTQNNG
jgi:hypothetical protein